jgi:thymidylate kinase
MIFLNKLFFSLKKQKINYCVLRNYQKLPSSTAGSDLDILINKEDKHKFMQLINNLCSDCNGKIVSIIESDICPRICLLGYDKSSWGIMIDLHYHEISYRGHTILSNKNIWNNIILNKNNISGLNKKSDALIGILKELLNNSTCADKYYNEFINYSLDEVFLNEIFDDIKKPLIVPLLMEFETRKYSKNTINDLKKVLQKFFPKQKKEIFTKISKIFRIFKQPGYCIAFMGVDGSGKSTIIDNITPVLEDAFHNAIYYEHMRPNKLSSIAKLTGRRANFNSSVDDPHGSSVSGFGLSVLRWAYYMLDYTFGFYLKVWPKKSIRSCVWLFDRYYYDYLIDPKRSRINLPTWIFKLGQSIIPKPDLIICLGTSPLIIHQRKPELTLKEVKRQVLALKKFSIDNEYAVWIDTGKDIKSSSSDTLQAIIEMMSKRFESVKIH